MTNRIDRCFFNSSFNVLSLVMVSLFAASTLWGQTPPITDIAFAPDGKSLVSCSQKGLQVFSWPELELQKTVEISFANLHCVVFSPDGNRLAIGAETRRSMVPLKSFRGPNANHILSCPTTMILSCRSFGEAIRTWSPRVSIVR